MVRVEGVHAEAVAGAVGRSTYARGEEYHRSGAVLHAEWCDEDLLLQAMVRGSGRRVYSTAVFFEPDGFGGLDLIDGECSCPMGFMCKHVAAVALSAVAADPAPVAPARPVWRGALDALLAPQATPATGTGRLAIEIALATYGDEAPRVTGRLLRPGKKGWVNGGLAWNRMEQPQARNEHRADHLALVRELYALHRTALGTSFDPYSYRAYYGGDEKDIDLGRIGGRRLWALLDEASAVGLELYHTRRDLGSLVRDRDAELSLDVTSGTQDASLALTPVVRFHSDEEPDADVRPVALLGEDSAHGLLVVSARDAREGTSHLPHRLVRLDPPAPIALAQAAVAQQVVTVPADAHDQFLEQYAPRLARMRTVISSDGSYDPPVISPPVLALRAAFGDDHALEITWQWSYDVGGSDTRAELAPPATGEEYRDVDAERAALTTAGDLVVDWRRFGLSREPIPGESAVGTPTAGGLRAARLSGLDTLAFTTEALPVLEDSDAVRVERTGAPADYREVGDALRIGLSTTESGSGTDWFDLGIDITVEGRTVPFAEVFTALADGETHLLRPDGAYFSLEKPELTALRELIDEARALQETPSGPLRISRYQAGWWEELAALGVVDRQARAWQEQVGGLLAPSALQQAEVPTTLAADLRAYQQEGFQWLAFLWRHRLGGVLADDMGLGKTVQALALICHARETDRGGPFLIVAPTSVVANWEHEAARFAPELSVVALTDTLKRRGEDLATVIAGADVVVTSYTLFRLDIEAHESVDWAGALFDEAQFLKNRQSRVHQSARRLAAPFKLALTGTPMENDLMELWSLLSVAAPGLFPSPQRFRETYARPIEKEADAELLARFRRRIRPLMLRRTKEQVSPELPDKQQQVLSVELTPAHRRLYQRQLQRERQKILGLIDDVDRHRFTILQSITRLRQLSLHPALVDESDAVGSTKIDVLVEQLRDVIGGGHRALVFSQFTRFLAHVRDALDAAGIAYAYLDGSSRSRDRIVAGFKNGEAPVFLISLKAGGFGLNLTEADYCFLLDPWWNPATETQAIDRTHRIGQEQTVMVYRLIAQDTIEEKVRALAERKAELFAGVMDDGATFASALTAEDIRALVS